MSKKAETLIPTTILPSLPKQNKKQEADFGLQFRRWWESHHWPGTFELKDTRGAKRFYFSQLEDEQIAVGTLAQGAGVLLRTASGTVGMADYIGVVRANVYIVINFPKGWYIIPQTILLEEKQTNKSMTEERARELDIKTP